MTTNSTKRAPSLSLDGISPASKRPKKVPEDSSKKGAPPKPSTANNDASENAFSRWSALNDSATALAKSFHSDLKKTTEKLRTYEAEAKQAGEKAVHLEQENKKLEEEKKKAEEALQSLKVAKQDLEASIERMKNELVTVDKPERSTTVRLTSAFQFSIYENEYKPINFVYIGNEKYWSGDWFVPLQQRM
ncbi:hypothetical protein MPER_13041 [Moniliophthora perniciosa FA553]|nr:hypothetical protein MPER_13041 [Moniliophthora perniciosa FA553]